MAGAFFLDYAHTMLDWIVFITSLAAFLIAMAVVLRFVAALVLLAFILAWGGIDGLFAKPRHLEPLRFTPEQWDAWNRRAASVVEDQIRRKQLYLLPPPSTSP